MAKKLNKESSKILSIDYRVFFLMCFILTFGILFLRYPNAFFNANFYAEEGKFWLVSIMENGFFSSVFEKFNGYLISGMYTMVYIAYILNEFITQQFVYMPVFMAFVANVFFAAVVCTPILLFYKRLSPALLFLLAVFSSFVPLGGWDYAVIGVIGDMKFLFVYLAFILTLYRFSIKENEKKMFAVDGLLVLSAFTNLTVFFIVPVIYLNYLKRIIRKEKSFKESLKGRGVISALVMAAIFSAYAISIAIQGLSKPTNYLTEAYVFEKTVDIFIGTSYIQPLLRGVYHMMNDGIVIGILAVVLGLMFFFGKKQKHLLIYLFGIYSIFIATFVFVATRTGVHKYFNDYMGTAPSQFFYAQNIIFIFLLIFLIQDIISSKKLNKWLRWLVASVIIIALTSSIPFSGTFGHSKNMNKSLAKIGTFEANLNRECKGPNDLFEIPIYPNDKQFIVLTREIACDMKE